MTVADPDPAKPVVPAASPDGSEWHSRVRLRLAANDGPTAIVEQTQHGRLSATAEGLADDDGLLDVAIAYPRSGVASGERSQLRVDVTDGGQALLTTAGPLRLHRSAGPVAVVDRQLTVSNGAELEWLPRECVVGVRAHATVNSRVILEEQARFIGWELASLGATPDGSVPTDGRLQQRLEVRRAGAALVDERVVVEAGVIRTSTGASGGTSFGTLVAVTPDGIVERVADELLRSLTRSPLPGSVWYASGTLVVRVPSLTAAAAAQELVRIWRRLRPLVIGREAEALEPTPA